MTASVAGSSLRIVKRTSVGHLNCSVARSLDVVGEWWTLLIVRNLMLGQRRFEAIQADLGIARNILSERLNTLLDHGLVERVKYQDHPERYEYHLTEQGRALFPVIVALMGWGDAWASPEGPPTELRHECGGQAKVEVVCSECRERLWLGDVRLKKGPGWRPMSLK